MGDAVHSRWPRPVSRGKFGSMDPATFTLFIWITTGEQVEERHIPNLSEAQCAARSKEIRKDKGPGVYTRCVRRGYVHPGRSRREDCPECAATARKRA